MRRKARLPKSDAPPHFTNHEPLSWQRPQLYSLQAHTFHHAARKEGEALFFIIERIGSLPAPFRESRAGASGSPGKQPEPAAMMIQGRAPDPSLKCIHSGTHARILDPPLSRRWEA